MRTFLRLEFPSARNRTSLRNWVWDEKPLFRKENSFLECGPDLAALAEGKESSWLDNMIGKALDWKLPRHVRFYSSLCAT